MFYFTLRYLFSDIPRQDSDENVSLKYTTQGVETKSCMREAYSLGGQNQELALPASQDCEMLLGKDQLHPPWGRTNEVPGQTLLLTFLLPHNHLGLFRDSAF